MRNKVKQLIIKNPGSIPATAILRLKKSSAFKILETREYTLMPKETKAFSIQFTPRDEKVFDEKLEVETLCNPYEKIQINLRGEGYFDILAFEDLGDKQDILLFDDIILSPDNLNCKPEVLRLPMKTLKNSRVIYDMTLSSEISPKLMTREIKVRNYSDKTIRFEWKDIYNKILIKPKMGHIGGNKTRTFKISILNRDISDYLCIDTRLNMEFEEIINVSQETQTLFDTWDCTLRTREMVERDALKQLILVWENENLKSKETVINLKGENKDGFYEVYKQLKEPHYEVVVKEVDKKQMKNKKIKTGKRSITLDVKASLDIPKIKCNVEEIVFLPTKMYSERIFNFSVRNQSKIKIPLICKIEQEDLQESTLIPDPGYFSVTPQERILEKETDNEYLIKFQPLECNPDIDRVLLLCMPPSKTDFILTNSQNTTLNQ
jgi:hypothetical protein